MLIPILEAFYWAGYMVFFMFYIIWSLPLIGPVIVSMMVISVLAELYRRFR